MNLMHWLYRSRQVTLVLQPISSKNDVTLCKLDVNVKIERRLLVASASFKLSRNSFKERKVLLYASSTLKVKHGKSKGMQEKVSIMGIWCG